MRCILCGIGVIRAGELQDIKKKSPFSKKSVVSIISYLAKSAKPPIDVTWTDQLDECYVCKSCFYDILLYDEYMVKLLEVQKRIVLSLRSPQHTEEFLTIQTLDECVDASNFTTENVEISFQNTTDACDSGDENISVSLDDNAFVENPNKESDISESFNDDAEEFESDKEPTTSTRRYNVQPAKCETCGKVFKNKSRLRRHINIVHKPSKQIFKCEICGKRAKDEEYLELHMNIHEGKSDLECRFCNKKYARKINVIRHMHKHWDKKNVQCERCGLRFSELPLYYNHKLQHEAEDQPLICEVCNQSFKTRRTYRNHLWVHREDRPRFSCEICGKTFVEKYTLKVHLKSHSEEGERSRGRRKRKLSQHDDKSFECIICGDQFSAQELCDQHMKVEHDVILKSEDLIE
ncbi:unnamed protein product [Ceratitis capitata]|uniref:(Mediterranean fruit fly) hypothetical protein n=1 Tax=Ceratitis capitata TaxID=7213 RepID=W8C9U5_CERCA|nr:unnamed protein product [Ceratitis capitata]